METSFIEDDFYLHSKVLTQERLFCLGEVTLVFNIKIDSYVIVEYVGELCSDFVAIMIDKKVEINTVVLRYPKSWKCCFLLNGRH